MHGCQPVIVLLVAGRFGVLSASMPTLLPHTNTKPVWNDTLHGPYHPIYYGMGNIIHGLSNTHVLDRYTSNPPPGGSGDMA